MARPSTPLNAALAKAELRRHATRIDEDPRTNSVFALANALFHALETGQHALKDMEHLIHEVFVALTDQRATRFRDQHQGLGTETAWQPLTDRLEALAVQGFDRFKTVLERNPGGIVFTAHPTFALSKTARAAFADFVTHPTAESQSHLQQSLTSDPRDWSKSITLEGEHAETQAAIANSQAAQRQYLSRAYAIAAHHFPNAWRTLNLAAPSLASWVGYDLDGRTDIHWSQSFGLRLREKAAQIARYRTLLQEIIQRHSATDPALAALLDTLIRAEQVANSDAALFSSNLSEASALVAAANGLTASNPNRISDASRLLIVLTTVIEAAQTPAPLAHDLAVLRSQIDALQLGTARIHLRVNAAQVRTVISRDLGLETENRELGRLALKRLAEKARESVPIEINFGDLLLEQSTARRQFMMCAQMLKHVDAGSTIRFLIAESENPATVMGALYLANQYGIADKLDISPLFETPEALESGGRFIERLLEEDAFLAYVRQRGHLSIQLGFSDSGRFIGQIAGNMAIERIHNLIARALARKDNSVALLIFNTHGESMGRGAWPGSFDQRFDHLLSHWTRSQAQKRGLRLMHEVSFQGGDGFLHFATQPLADSTYAAFAAHLLSEPDPCTDDPFYTRTDFVWDFYRSLRNWQERLFNNPDYGRLLSDFATNLVVKAGSRQRRRTGGPVGPRALRAISHNATLQQLGIPVNTAAGIGSSIRRENDRLIEIINQSKRLRGLIGLALHARLYTTVPTLRAYGEVYNPSYWVAISHQGSAERAPNYRNVYYTLQDSETPGSINRIANRLSVDLGKFDRLVAQLDDAPSTDERHALRLDLHVLHAVRQALMLKALALSGQIPTLSERHDLSARDIAVMIQRMEIAEAVSALRKIFPTSLDGEAALTHLTEAGSHAGASGQAQGYDRLHAEVITPLDEIDRLLQITTLAVCQAYGAFG